MCKLKLSGEALTGEVAVALPASLALFERWGIDYAGHAQRSLRDAAALADRDLEPVLQALRGLQADRAKPDWQQLSIDRLVDFIQTRHHAYARRAVIGLRPAMVKVFLAHGDSHHPLGYLAEIVEAMFGDLEQHLDFEDSYLFPRFLTLSPDDNLHAYLEKIEFEHARGKQFLRDIRDLTEGFQAPANADTTFKALYSGLAALESDLHQHMHLENDILHGKEKWSEKTEPIEQPVLVYPLGRHSKANDKKTPHPQSRIQGPGGA